VVIVVCINLVVQYTGSMILIVGRHFTELREYLKKKDIPQFLLCDEALGETHAKKQGVPYILADFSSRESITESLKRLPEAINASVALFENYVLPSAWISHELGINGLPIISAEACTDKEFMRERFKQAPEKISPDFSVITSELDLQKFAAHHQFPLVLKPANLVKSLLVTTCRNQEELDQAYLHISKSITAIYKRYAPHRIPKLIVEEFLEGRIYSVDAFVDGDGQPHVLEAVVDYQTGQEIGFNDNFHYARLLPSSLSQTDQDSLRHVATLGVQALGMRYSAAHIEMIRTKKGPRIVEIGARNGGYRERMHALANGIDLYLQLINTLTNQPINVKNKKNDHCAVLELFPKKPGSFHALVHEAELRNLSSLHYLSIKAQPGVEIGLSSEGYKAAAVIMLYNHNTAQFQKDLDYVNHHVFIETW
jgi:glutathione synthase/RimK-type ligase-like ATP-grasp enzyme